jgi:hypothetical protein
LIEAVRAWADWLIRGVSFGLRTGLAWLSLGLRQIGRWIRAPFALAFRGWLAAPLWAKLVVVALLLPWGLGYLNFFWSASILRGYDPEYPSRLGIEARMAAPRAPLPAAEGVAAQCGTSFIVAAAIDLLDFEVNQNAWLPSNPLYKLGLFGIPWERTRFFDNKAAFELGIHRAVARTAVELADTLGRERGTSEIDADLGSARSGVQFDTGTWYFNPFSPRPFGPTTATPTYYRNALASLRRYQERLGNCEAGFDARADNLLQFVDRIASDIGAATATLMERAEASNAGWLDMRADDYFMFAKGQLYAYWGILTGTRADFAEIVDSRELNAIWDNLDQHLRRAVALDPLVISNGSEDGFLFPSHLETLGFYALRARSNLVEIRTVLER